MTYDDADDQRCINIYRSYYLTQGHQTIDQEVEAQTNHQNDLR